MTSSLRSRFSLADRRAVCIAGDKVFVHHWSHGALAESFAFDADEAGLAEFERYLVQSPSMPVRILVDVVEEEYRQETIPHVFGRDRRALIERKMGRLFRGTPYRQALLQGREGEGRRDDRLLVTALMNPAIVRPWVQMLIRHKVPLAGICSLPLLSRQLLIRLQIKSENTLLVSLQSASGLRQSFFRNQEMKVSRLARMPRLGTVPFAGYLLGELEKLRRYLNSLRLVARDSPIETYVLSHGEALEDLQRNCRDTEQVRYHLLDVREVAAAVGLEGELATPYADRIFAHLLLASPVGNHYATREETRYFTLHRARIGMLAASVVLLLASAAASGFNFIEAVALKQEALSASQKADFYQARYEMAREGLPRTPVEPRDVERAVQVVSELAGHRPSPLQVMRLVSDALRGFPDFRLDRLDWLASADPERPLGREAGGGEGGGPDAGGAGEFDYYHVAVLEGHLEPFDGDYRRALEAVNGFAETLRGAANVHRVRILRLPLDVSSSARLEGSADGERRRAEAAFAVRLVVGVDDGAG